MAEETIIRVGANTPEHIAYLLLATVAQHEGKTLSSTVQGRATADRKWLLDAYSECLLAITAPELRHPRPEPSE